MAADSKEEPEWNEDEFGTLLANPHWSTDYLAAMLGRRSSTSVALVRQGVCDFHKQRPNLFLSKMMLAELQGRKGRRSCYVCEEVF